MSSSSITLAARVGLLCLGCILSLGSAAQAQTMVAADQSVAPGKLFEVRDTGLANFFTRWTSFEGSPVQNRIGSIAIDNGQHYFYCSGLDGCVFEYNGKDELRTIDVRGQVRHVALDRQANILYYSIVETPQDGQALADGVIGAYDLNTHRPTKTFRIAQADLKGEFYGAIAAGNGQLYLATDSVVYSYNRGNWGEVFRSGGDVIRGLAVAPWGQTYFVDGAQGVFAFEKNGAATKVSTLNTTSLTHIAWLPEAAPAAGGSKPAPLANPPVEGVKTGDSGAPQVGTVQVQRPAATSSIQGNVQGLSAAQRAGVRVTLTSELGFARAVGIDARSHFMINPLPAGKYIVSVRSEDSSIRFANSSQTIDLGDRTSQQVLFSVQGTRGDRVPLPATSSIQGNVIGLAAARVNRTFVSVVSHNGSVRRQLPLDSRGYFMADRLPAGNYTVSIIDQSGGQIGRAQEVTLAAMTSQQVILQVR